MITESAFLGNGVYVEEDQYGTIMLSYGGEGAPRVVLNKEAIKSLLVFLKVVSLADLTKLRKELREEVERANS